MELPWGSALSRQFFIESNNNKNKNKDHPLIAGINVFAIIIVYIQRNFNVQL